MWLGVVGIVTSLRSILTQDQLGRRSRGSVPLGVAVSEAMHRMPHPLTTLSGMESSWVSTLWSGGASSCAMFACYPVCVET